MSNIKGLGGICCISCLTAYSTGATHSVDTGLEKARVKVYEKMLMIVQCHNAYIGHGILSWNNVHVMWKMKDQNGGFTFIHSAESLSLVVKVSKKSRSVLLVFLI